MKIHWHRWTLAHDTGVHRYLECRTCGKREVSRSIFRGKQPIATKWLAGGEWVDELGPPPRTKRGVK